MTTLRRHKRQETNALKLFNSLWNEFIEFESTNSIAIGGYVRHQNDVAAKIKSLHNEWKYFVNRRNANPKSIDFKLMAFKDKVEQYLLKKDKQVWVSYTMELAFNKYGFIAPIADFEKVYSTDILPIDAIKSLIYKTNAMLIVNLSYHKIIGKYSKETPIPEKFSELTRKQFLSFVEMAGKGYTDYELKLQFIRKHFFKLPIGRIQAYKKFSELKKGEAYAKAYYEGWIDNSSSIHQLVKLFAFLSEPPTCELNPVPKYKLLKGPADKLKNISIWEFALAEKAMFDFATDKNIKNLDVLCGILMRRRSIHKVIKSWFTFVDDVRKDFHDEEIVKLAKATSSMPEHYKFAILAFFRSVRESFTDLFPNVYDNVEKKDGEEDGNWGDVIMNFSGEVPGNESNIANVNLYTFLYRLDKLISDQKKQLEKIKK